MSFNNVFTSILLKHPRTGELDPTLTITAITVLLVVVKFFFEGMSFEVLGSQVNLGHADAMSYGAVLTPLMGAHASREWRIPPIQRVDDPDA